MRRSMIIDFTQLDYLVQTPDYEHIVMGVGELARDLRKKLMLLGLKAPYLLGMETDPENDILGYNELDTLGDPKKYKFIMSCDTSERELMMLSQSAMNKYLGRADIHHPQFFLYGDWDVVLEAGNLTNDSITCITTITNGLPYIVYGAREKKDSFRIHIMGSCHGGGNAPYSKRTFAESLHDKLNERGFENVMFDWQHIKHRTANNLSRFIRDVSFHKIDLLILYSNVSDFSPLTFSTVNALAAKAGVGNSPMVEKITGIGLDASNGIHHNTDLISVKAIQNKTLAALARRHEFVFWDVIGVTTDILSEEHGHAFSGYPKRYFSRQRQKKERLLSVLDSRYTKDYTDAFDDVDDIFSVFADYGHYSDKGNELIAERLAADILKEFGDVKGARHG